MSKKHFEIVAEALLEADVDVIDIENNDNHITIFAPQADYGKARNTLTDTLELELEVDEIQFVPQTQTDLSPEDQEILSKLLALLDDLEDVQSVYHNASL